MTPARRDVLCRAVSMLAALTFAAALLLAYADRTVLDSATFADRAAATLERPIVQREAGRRLADEAVRAQPDLIGVRAVLERAARTVVGTAAFRALVRQATHDVHRQIVVDGADHIVLRLPDGGTVLGGALARAHPLLARHLAPELRISLADTSSGAPHAAVRLAARGEAIRRGRWIALVLAVALAAVAVGIASSRRAAVQRLALTTAVTVGLLALLVALAPALLSWNEVTRALLASWTRPLAVLAAGAAGVAGAAALAARLSAPDTGSAPESPRTGRALRLGAVAVTGAVIAGAAAALADDTIPAVPHTGRCNGRAALCDRRLNDVAFVATHNSMAADREPGWLFPAQEAGIPVQLQDGVRALLIDTHYGFATPRGVLTDLSGPTKSREKLVAELGATLTDTALRARDRIGAPGDAPRELFLCHGFCEVGATRAVDALREVHRFLVMHPEEVLVLSLEDDTSAADTAQAITRSGLSHEVYRGPARPPWPTLRQMIDRDQRVLVLAEKHGREGPSWMHPQPQVAQETPYAFPTPAALQAPGSCRPFRGGTAGSLLLINHWVDTTPSPRPSNAAVVNARGFLSRRLARCRRTRGMLPNLVAVDFYREGDVFGVVDALNGG